MSDFSRDLEKFSEFFDINIDLSDINFLNIEFKSKFDESIFVYVTKLIDIKNYPNDDSTPSKIISDLTSIIRDYKINNLI